jgi:hypothetical protein
MRSVLESVGGTVVKDSTPQEQTAVTERRDGIEDALEQVRMLLRRLRYGSVNVIVQDGVVVQIDCTEKRRLRSAGNSTR